MTDHEVALYCERALNNFPVSGRRLVIDFALEDQRKILKREKKKESFLKNIKKEQTKIDTKKAHKKKESQKNENISDITDIKKLKQLLKNCKERGRKQRIKKKLISLGAIKPQEKLKIEKEPMKEVEKDEKIIKLTGKRKREYEENMEIEKEIMKSRKQSKRKKRDEIRHKADQFDVLLSIVIENA